MSDSLALSDLQAEQRRGSRYVLDYLGVIMYVLSILWLGFALIALREETVQLRILRMMIFLLVGSGAFLFGLRVQMRFTMRDMVTILVVGAPIFLIGGLALIGGSPQMPSTVTVVYYICVGTAEELFFRGFLFLLTGRMVAVWGVRGKLINYLLNGLLFGIYHAYAYGGDIGAMVTAAAAGMLFAIIFDTTGHLSYPMVIHAVYDIMLAIATGHAPLGV